MPSGHRLAIHRCCSLTRIHIRCIKDMQPEVPSLELHEHPAELGPGDRLAINNDQRNLAVLLLVPFDPAAYRHIPDREPSIGDVAPLGVLLRQTATDSAEEPRERASRFSLS